MTVYRELSATRQKRQAGAPFVHERFHSAHPRGPASKANARASRAREAGNASDQGPSATSHAAPKAQPTAKPTITGRVCAARLRALATSAGSPPSSTSPTSNPKRVTLLVITAVEGALLERELHNGILLPLLDGQAAATGTADRYLRLCASQLYRPRAAPGRKRWSDPLLQRGG